MSPTKNRKIFFGISIVLVVASIALMLFKGFNLGIDFTGGNLYQFEMGKTVTTDMENQMEKLVSDAIGGQQVSVQATDNTQIIVKTPELDNETSLSVINAVKSEFSLEQENIISNEKVNGTVSGRLKGRYHCGYPYAAVYHRPL